MKRESEFVLTVRGTRAERVDLFNVLADFFEASDLEVLIDTRDTRLHPDIKRHWRAAGAPKGALVRDRIVIGVPDPTIPGCTLGSRVA